MEEEKLGCLGDGAENTDYRLCNGDSDLLPPLIKKDEIRFEYNQYANDWSWLSCTVFAAIGMLSDLINYEFSYDQIKEVDELTYTTDNYPKRTRGQGYWVKYAVGVVADWYNSSELAKKKGQIAYYRISKYDDEIVEDVIGKLYTIDGNYCPTKEYNADKKDGIVDGTDFGTNTNGHSVDIIKYQGQRSVKDSGSTKNNVYGLKNKLSAITNYGQYFYVYVLVGEHLEEIKRLNEFRTILLRSIEDNSKMWHLTNDEKYKNKLHEMNEENRSKVKDIENQLKRFNKYQQ